MNQKPITSPSRRALLLGTGSLLLTGCGTNSTWGILGQTVALSLDRNKAYPRTREQVEALPYAQIGLRIGDGVPGILVLSDRSGDDLHWVSSNRIMISTRQGRIVRSVGLEIDLLSVRPQGPDLLQRYAPEQQTLTSLDHAFTMDSGTRYSIPVSSRFKIENSETIDVLGERIDTLRVTEKIECEVLRWRATNTYWLSKRSALVWRSRQQLAPGQPHLEYEVLKRPA